MESESKKIVISKNGQDIECDVLFTFDSEQTGKTYIGYSDQSIASNKRKNIYVTSFDPILGPGSAEMVSDERELDMIKDVLEQIDRGSRKK